MGWIWNANLREVHFHRYLFFKFLLPSALLIPSYGCGVALLHILLMPTVLFFGVPPGKFEAWLPSFAGAKILYLSSCLKSLSKQHFNIFQSGKYFRARVVPAYAYFSRALHSLRAWPANLSLLFQLFDDT